MVIVIFLCVRCRVKDKGKNYIELDKCNKFVEENFFQLPALINYPQYHNPQLKIERIGLYLKTSFFNVWSQSCLYYELYSIHDEKFGLTLSKKLCFFLTCIEFSFYCILAVIYFE